MLYRPLGSGQDALLALTELQMAVSFLPAREQELGSLRFLLWLGMNSAGSNVLFLLFLKLYSKLSGYCAEFRSNQGPWSLAVICLTLQALEHPHVRTNLLGLVEISQKWYPLAIGLLLSALNGSVQWETFAAVLFAYIWRTFRLDRALPSSHTAAKLEDQLRLPGLLGMLGGHWVPATSRPPRQPRQLREPRDAGRSSGLSLVRIS